MFDTFVIDCTGPLWFNKRPCIKIDKNENKNEFTRLVDELLLGKKSMGNNFARNSYEDERTGINDEFYDPQFFEFSQDA